MKQWRVFAAGSSEEATEILNELEEQYWEFAVHAQSVATLDGASWITMTVSFLTEPPFDPAERGK